MQTPIFKDFLNTLLQNNNIQRSKVSKVIINSSDYKQLKLGEVIQEKKTTNGGYIITVLQHDRLQAYFNKKYPHEIIGETDGVTNAKNFRNSKAIKRRSQGILLLRGSTTIKANDIAVDLEYQTKNWGVFSFKIDSLEADKIFFVENLDVFMRIEQIITEDYVFIHAYGRVGKELLSKIKCTEVVVFSDYDYVGLNEYLKIKEVFPNATFYMPTDFEDMHHRFKTLEPINQRISERVKQSNDPLALRVKKVLDETGQLLEQQQLF